MCMHNIMLLCVRHTHIDTITFQDESSGVDDFVRGELRLGLMFQPSAIATPSSDPVDRGTLNILIKAARDLPAMSTVGLADTVVKCFLLPDRSSSGKRKTGVVKNNLNPVWEERMGYENVSLRGLLSERVLELTLWQHDKHGNEFIGGMRVGGAPGRSPHQQKWMDAIGAEVSHWEDMLSQPGKWIEEWHTLRPSMVPREVDLSKTPPPFTIPSLTPPTARSHSDIESEAQSGSNISPLAEAGTILRATEDPLPPSLPDTSRGAGILPAARQVPAIQLDIDPSHSNSETPPSPPHSLPPLLPQPDTNGLYSQEQPFEDEPKPKPRVSD